MKINLSRYALPAIAAVMLVAGPVSSFAQNAAQTGSLYTQATVLQGAPFGNLPIVRDLDEDYIADIVVSLGAVQLAELNGRCTVVNDHPWYYGLITAEFCERVLVEQGLIEDSDDSSSSSSSSSSD